MTPSPSPAPTSKILPNGNCAGGKGHWEVNIKTVNASYSQINGYAGAFNPLNGIKVRRLIE